MEPAGLIGYALKEKNTLRFCVDYEKFGVVAWQNWY